MTRVGTFTSSQMYRLCSFGRGAKTVDNVGAAFYTYIEEVKWEEELGVSARKEVSAKSLEWGKLLEKYVYFTKLGDEYTAYGKNRLIHPNYDRWTGIPDFDKQGIVSELKCPYAIASGLITRLKSYKEGIETFKKLKPDDYLQLVSNSILSDCKEVEAITYIPYQKELMKIRDFAREQLDEEEKTNLFWLEYARDEELPHIANDSKVKDLNKFTFEVPKEDKEFLTKRVEMALRHFA